MLCEKTESAKRTFVCTVVAEVGSVAWVVHGFKSISYDDILHACMCYIVTNVL